MLSFRLFNLVKSGQALKANGGGGEVESESMYLDWESSSTKHVCVQEERGLKFFKILRTYYVAKRSLQVIATIVISCQNS